MTARFKHLSRMTLEEKTAALERLDQLAAELRAELDRKPCPFCRGSGVVRVKDPHPIPVTADCPEGCAR